VAPAVITSPTSTAAGESIRWLFTKVPLREPRSSMYQRLPSAKKRACRRDSARSPSTISDRDERPSTASGARTVVSRVRPLRVMRSSITAAG
jgi:hypothetical protein